MEEEVIRILHDETSDHGLWIGDQKDFSSITDPSRWAVCHAAKEPFHRVALGYTGRSAPKDHPEYLFAYRPLNSVKPDRLILNLVDAPDPAYVSPALIDEALNFIWWKFPQENVLVHCNAGHSRAAVIGMLFLAAKGLLHPDFEISEGRFKTLYPPYEPGAGLRGFAKENWERYWKLWDPDRPTCKGESAQ